MEQNTYLPDLSQPDMDPETFRRVWERVMPDQRESPLVVDSPTSDLPPARPGPRPEQGGDSTSTPPAVPACPPLSQCPACLSCPVPTTEAEEVSLCLGEQSRSQAGKLEELIGLARAGIQAGRELSRRSGQGSKALSALESDHRRAVRRLSAAYFLITGRRANPRRSGVSLPSSLFQALRSQFLWEQQWERCNRQAARETRDPCLAALYLELAEDGALHAAHIRSMLERMLSP